MSVGTQTQSRLFVIDDLLPTTPQSSPQFPTSTTLTTIGTSSAINGLAFGGDGYLYIAGPQLLFQVHPTTGAVIRELNMSAADSVDLASCARPSTVVVKKNFPEGRANPGEQVDLTVTGGGIARGNTGTTRGDDPGLQDAEPEEYAGPVLGLPGTTYTVTESGAGASSRYARSWRCVNETDGTVVATGQGTTGSFTMPNGGAAGADVVCTFSNVPLRPGIEVDKQAGAPSGNRVGDTITYTFVVTNTGNVPLQTPTIDDPKVGAVTCPAGQVPPGQSVTCTAPPYVLTQADVDAGVVHNTATVTGRPVDPDLPVVTDDDTTTTPITRTPQLALEKHAGTPVDANGSGLVDVGDTIQYTFTVTNTGNVTVHDLAIDDAKAGAVTCDPTTLAPGAVATCRANDPYVITSADQSAGEVVNTAVALGEDPTDAAVRSNEDSTRTPVDTPAPRLALVKRAATPVDVNGDGLVNAGDTVQFTFTVTNTGNIPINQILVDDPKLTAAGIGITCDVTSLAPNEATTCRADGLYTITDEDEADASADNVATARGVAATGRRTESEPSEVSIPLEAAAPGLSVVKEAGDPVDANGSGIIDAGDTIQYTFTVTNTGNVTIDDLVIEDPMLTDAGITITCAPTTLAPSEVATCAADDVYVITADDAAAGVVNNTATAVGDGPGGERVTSEPDSTSTPSEEGAAALEMDKIAEAPVDVNGNGITDAGDTIRYRFTVTNTGNVTVFDVAISDPKLEGAGITITCDPTTLPVDQTATCTTDRPYVITADDEAAGLAENTAAAVATNPDDEPVRSPDDTTRTPVVAPAPALSLVKTADQPRDVNRSGITDAGDYIRFRFAVTNTGNVPLTDLRIVDPKVGSATCEATSLAPAASTTCVADAVYVITEDDERAGQVHNTALARATDPADPDAGPVESDESSTTTPVQTPDPRLELVKRAGTPTDVNGSGITDAGDTIQFTFTVTNTGNVPLSLLNIEDDMLGGQSIPITCEITTLAPGASTTCRADRPYVVTETDEARGSVNNVAVARATDPDAGPVTSDESSTSTPVQTPAPRLELVKEAGDLVDANGSGRADAGDTIRFRFTVTNTGNVPVREVVVRDPMLTDAGITVTCTPTALAPGEVATCTTDADYEVTQADVDRGVVANVATARGVDPDDDPVVSDEADTRTPLSKQATLSLEKEVSAPHDLNDSGITDAGDALGYRFVVTNTGNVTVSDVRIVDDLLDGVGIVITCRPTTLAPGETTTCTTNRRYFITEADERAGVVDNTATAHGMDPDDEQVVSNEDSTSTPVQTPDPKLELVKQAGTPVDTNDSGITDAGDTITYTFTVTNTGNVPIRDVAVSDPMLNAAGITITCDPTTLAPQETTTCTTDQPYVITTDDVTAGTVDNTATATGTDPDDGTVTSNEDSTSTPVQTPDPKLELVKQAGTPVDTNDSGITDAGDTITYTFTVTNTGNVPIRDVAVSDPMLNAADITITCDPTTLAPQETTTCTTDQPYVITTDDVTAGTVDNTATATGTDPDDGTVTSNEDSTSTPVQTPDPKLRLEKSAGAVRDVDGSGTVSAGDTIAYTFTVTNTGNVPIRDVVVSDPMLSAAGITITCDPTTLAPGAAANCAADDDYEITQDDVDAGHVVNVATARGTDPDGGAVASPEDEATTTLPPVIDLRLDKLAGAPTDANGSGITDAGDTIRYTFTVTNQGNVTVRDIAIDDPRLAAAGLTVTCDPTTLAPQETATCTTDGDYVITADDVEAGTVDNTATATGVDPTDGEVRSNEDSTSTPVTRPAPSLHLVKEAGTPTDVDGDGVIAAGDTIAYTFTVTNNGNVPVDDLAVSDPKVGTVSCERTRLEVGASTRCAADAVYVITEADQSAGRVDNVAVANGTDPDGGVVESPEATTSTPVVAPDPKLDLLKSAAAPVDRNGSGRIDAGDTIAFTFTVTNTGNVPVSGIRVVDPLVGEVACDETTLAPGASTPCRAVEPYVLTQDDIDAGTVHNVAHAEGLPPSGQPVVSPDAETTTPINRQPGLSLVKQAALQDTNGNGKADVGESIIFTFTLTNTGNVRLTGVTVTDPMVGDVTCARTSLAPGEQTTCRAAKPYVVTAADAEKGSVVNVATASGSAGGDQVVTSPPSSTTTPTVRPDAPKSPDPTSPKEPKVPETAGLPDAGGPAGWLLVGGLALLLGGGVLLLGVRGRRG
ncbi:DUF7507 domain-containing protein [Nocardioides nitrophenolicus]|uniref:DUF7507 domain-containing protein n=1 Tax=Nocardioides nitrophenolicus TaxID=60489 RepID=UPI0019565F7F|nr:DUF11 domain-containing protein [Nocardioides nitrophenolicus]MBM7519112.1 putative repeat protein (TIGR01451 family) [Nocardioides nitrophenolicus]